MFYPTSKFHDNHVSTFGFLGKKPPPPPRPRNSKNALVTWEKVKKYQCSNDVSPPFSRGRWAGFQLTSALHVVHYLSYFPVKLKNCTVLENKSLEYQESCVPPENGFGSNFLPFSTKEYLPIPLSYSIVNVSFGFLIS